LWGLAFKPVTNDMREATSLVLIDRLTQAGAAVIAYDPAATDECRRRIGDRIAYAGDMYEATVDADALLIVTEWKQFRIPSWRVVARAMRGKLVLDGRNLYDPAEVEDADLVYSAIGLK
ncbi:MAG: UDP-glucose 6-dehydrogenase, partial [Alistipes sp.]|nr:UDP-glucose 6-dehydrogenase [Alistipes sp.]